MVVAKRHYVWMLLDDRADLVYSTDFFVTAGFVAEMDADKNQRRMLITDSHTPHTVGIIEPRRRAIAFKDAVE